MGDSTMAVIAIFLAAILMFVFPLMTMADKKDEVSALTAQTATTEFVDQIRTTGQLTQEQYDNYMQTLAATGNSFDVDITIQVSDENPSKKQVSITDNVGNTVYYEMHTKQVLDTLAEYDILTLKEGDIVSVVATNTNVTIGMQLRNFMYKVTGNNSSTITASASGIATANGQ